MNPLLRNRITIRLFVRGLNALIKAVVFDVDGTLYDETYPKVKAELLTAEFISDKSCVNVEDVYNTFREVKAQITSEYGGRPERNDRRIWYEETLRRLSVTNISKEEASTYYWQVVYSSIEPYIDLLYVLPQFARKYKLFTLSDELSEIHREKIKRLGLAGFFVNSISAEEAGEAKPSRKLFDYALEIIGESPSAVLVVGDNPAADIKGGNLAGMHTAWLQRGKYHYYPRSGDEKPDIVFTNYIQLEGKIKNLEAS